MAKRNRTVSFDKMAPELVNLVDEKFPFGFEERIKSYRTGSGKRFYAFDLMNEECNYLIKVDVDVDFSLIWNDDEEAKNEDAD